MAAKNKSFTVMARINLEISLELNALTLEEAALKAKEFKYTDFVEVTGDLCDHHMKVVSVWEGDVACSKGLD